MQVLRTHMSAISNASRFAIILFIGAPLKKRHAVECMGIDGDAAISRRLISLYRTIAFERLALDFFVLRGANQWNPERRCLLQGEPTCHGHHVTGA